MKRLAEISETYFDVISVTILPGFNVKRTRKVFMYECSFIVKVSHDSINNDLPKRLVGASVRADRAVI